MILIVLDNTSVSGVGRWVLDVARAVSPSAPVTVVTLQDNGALSPKIRATGAALITPSQGSPRGIRGARELYTLIRRVDPDVVHLTKVSAATLVTAFLLRRRVQVEASVHTYPTTWRGTLSHLLAPVACSRVIAISPGVYRHLDRLLPRRLAKKVRIEPNIVATPCSVRISTAEAACRVGLVSRLTRNKGLDWALQVMQATSGSEVEFHVFGDGPLAEELRGSLASANASIVWHGFELDLDVLYGHIDYLLACSAEETFGLTLAEAAIRGVPLLVRDAYAYVRDLHLPVLFCANDDPQAMAGFISTLPAREAWALVEHRRSLHVQASEQYSEIRMLKHFAPARAETP